MLRSALGCGVLRGSKRGVANRRCPRCPCASGRRKVTQAYTSLPCQDPVSYENTNPENGRSRQGRRGTGTGSGVELRARGRSESNCRAGSESPRASAAQQKEVQGRGSCRNHVVGGRTDMTAVCLRSDQAEGKAESSQNDTESHPQALPLPHDTETRSQHGNQKGLRLKPHSTRLGSSGQRAAGNVC